MKKTFVSLLLLFATFGAHGFGIGNSQDPSPSPPLQEEVVQDPPLQEEDFVQDPLLQEEDFVQDPFLQEEVVQDPPLQEHPSPPPPLQEEVVQEDDASSSICAAEGEWKTNMCAKIIDFYGDVTCRKKMLVVQEDGSTIDIVETITTLFAENLELKNRLAAVESTLGVGTQSK